MIDSAALQNTMLFAGGRDTNLVYRYQILGMGSVTALASITHPDLASPFGSVPIPAISPAGELFVVNPVGNGGQGSISRFLNPAASTPAFNGTITSNVFDAPAIGQFAGDGLFVAQMAGDSVVEVVPNDVGTGASVIGVVTDVAASGIAHGAGPRGAIVTPWNELFVTYCCGLNFIQRYRFDSTGHAIPNGTITGNGLNNPHQMTFSPWGELFVGSPGPNNSTFTGTSDGSTTTVSRFIFDAEYDAIPNGVITSASFSGAFGVVFSPWGELFVGNLFGPGISRFVFDAAHTATPNGSIATPGPVGSLAFATVSPTVGLTIGKTGAGSGTVTSNPAGIACGATCTQTFATGTVVTLQATPDTKNFFAGWDGACHGTGSCTVTITTGQTAVTATFTPQLIVKKTGTGTGTVTGGPINCGARCTANAADGVVLTATPATNSAFTGWSGAGCSGTGTCTPSGSNRTVTATFDVKSFTLSVTTTGAGAGTVTGGAISCSSGGGGVCSTAGAFNRILVLRAIPAAGSFFSGWTGSCRGQSICLIHFTAAQGVTATFTPQVTVTKIGTGTGVVSSVPGTLSCGSRCTGNVPDGGVLTATPASNSTFSGWSGAGCSGTGTCTPTGSNRSVTATFSHK